MFKFLTQRHNLLEVLGSKPQSTKSHNHYAPDPSLISVKSLDLLGSKTEGSFLLDAYISKTGLTANN
jgi:hypothetical protein